MFSHASLRTAFIESLRITVPTVLIVSALAAPASAQLLDGTSVSVRMQGTVNTERTKTGDAVAFVVLQNILAGHDILIRKGTPVSGRIVKAQRAEWSWLQHDAKLNFAFEYTVATDGQVIRLRSSPQREKKDRVRIDRNGREHDLQWASEADVFTAYIDGNYDFGGAP